jgi:xylulokinase
MAELGCDPVNTVYTAGGAAKSLVWLKIRANILNRRLLVPKVVEASMGAAILAASTIRFNGTSEAVDAMVKIDKEVIPDPKISQRYNSFYSLFKTACTERGYINSSGETL